MTIESEPQRSRRGPRIIVLGAAMAALAAVVTVARQSMERSVHIKMSITIDRPVDEVFAFVSDARNVLQWLPAAVDRRKLSEGPVGVGTRFEGTDRIGRRLVKHTQEIIAFEPGRSVTTRMSPPWAGDYEIRVEPADGGTLLSVDTTAQPSGTARLFSLVPDSIMARSFERDYTRLKELLEGQKEPKAIPIEPDVEAVGMTEDEQVTP